MSPYKYDVPVLHSMLDSRCDVGKESSRTQSHEENTLATVQEKNLSLHRSHSDDACTFQGSGKPKANASVLKS